jgi:hypothetical protein
MEIKPEVYWIGILSFVVLAILILSDAHKRWLVENAHATGRQVKKHWLANKTDWVRVVMLMVGFAAYLLLLNNPQWIPAELPQPLRPLEPLVKLMFRELPSEHQLNNQGK